MPWDEDFRYEVKDSSFLRGLGFVFAMAAILTATVFMALAGRIPPNRGELTVEEFAENYNFQMRYYDVQDNTYLGEDGKWLSRMYDGSVIAHIGENPEFSYTQENGRVTAVHITQTGDEDYLYSLPLSQLRFAAVALAAGAGEGALAVYGQAGERHPTVGGL